MVHRILLFCFLFISTFSFGQKAFNLIFNHLTRDKGLSNTNVLSMLQDRRGFIWMATMNGLNRFDGSNVKVYKTYNSSLKGNYINKLIEDNHGRIWIGTNLGLSYYNDISDEFVQLEGPVKGKEYGAIPYYVDDNNNIWLTITIDDKVDMYIYNLKTKSYTLVLKNVPKKLAEINQKPNLPLKSLYYTDGKGLVKQSIINYEVVKTERFLDGNSKVPKLNNIISINIENDSTLWLTNSTHGLTQFNLLKNKHESFLYFGKQKMFTLNQIVQYGGFILVSGNNGITVFDKKNRKFVQIILQEASNPYSLSASYVEYLYLGKNNNLYCSLYGNGVDYTTLKKHQGENIFTIETAKSIGLLDNTTFRMFKKDENVLAKMQNGGTVEINQKGQVVNQIKQSGQPIFVDNKQRYWTTQNSEQNKILIYDKNLKLVKSLDPKPLFNWFSFYGKGLDLGNGKYLISNLTGVFEYNENKNTWLEITANAKTGAPINTFYYDKKNQELYVSSNWWNKFTVYSYKNNTWKYKCNIKLERNVYCINPSFKTNYIYIGSNKGLLHFNTQTNKYSVKTEKEGLPDDAISDIIEEKNGDYWLVSDKGIAYYTKAKGSFREFTIIDGADSKNYNGNQNFRMSDSTLMFGGSNGVTKLNNTTYTQSISKPNIEITEISSNEKPVKTTNLSTTGVPELNLAAEQNSFGISFVAIDYTQSRNLVLRYKLGGIDNDWIRTQNPNTARYSKVKEGTYMFEMQVLDASSREILNSKKLQIYVAAPFYRSSWFRVLMASMLIGAAYFFYKLRSQQIRNETKKIEQIRRIRAESEINALRSQMNPHFIFNCLNTVDSYILLNKTEEASNFLHKFSKLIRMILENSRQEFIPIKQDIEALELYIKLEQERSFPRFTYMLEVDPKCLVSTLYIPATILQPYVENAILHGLRHKTDGSGILKLQYVIQAEALEVNLEDNGIGRKAADILNFEKNQHKTSLGLTLTQERIEKLNDLYPNSASIEIKDNINENGSGGTMVKVKLPLLTLDQINL